MMKLHKRIRKKLYKALKRAQADDVPIPAPRLVEIKFYIRNDRRAQHIIVRDGDPTQDTWIPLPSSSPSKFIMSQLQAQKITDLSRTSRQLLAVLAVTSTYLAQDPLEPPSYATYLTWHNQETHRTYCVFGYLTCPMESRVYSAAELLRLRDSWSSQLPHDGIKFNSEIAEIVKKKNSDPPVQPHRLKKIKGDISSSTEESEEQVLFKGKRQRPATNGRMEWRYRGRSSSEVTSNEPIAAPAGLAAQRSEGFQRFFKAVVSPTHVRVTAGGRIVPNTRVAASASPTTKAEKNRADEEIDESVSISKNGKSEALNETNGSSFPSAGSQMMLPGHSAAFPHLGLPVPLIPMHNGIALPYGFPQQQSQPSGPINAPSSARATADAEKTAPMAQAADGNDTYKSQPVPVEVSHPEKFDHTKPYYYNGHLVLPIQGHAPMILPNSYTPQGVAGSQAVLAPPRMAHMGHPSTVPMFTPPGFFPGSYGPTPAPAGSQATHAYSHRAGQLVTPPMSSIRASDVTKQQLNHLRHSLQYLETQLLYNKHQIDEKAVRERADRFRSDIREFEHKLKMQLDYEAMYYPNQSQGSEPLVTAPYNTSSRPPSMKENRSDNVTRDGSVDSGKQLANLGNKESSSHSRRRGKGQKNRNAIGINAFRCDAEQAKSTALDELVAHHRDVLGLEKKYCLPAGSAFAQSFQFGSVSGDGQNESQPWRGGDENNQSQPVANDAQKERKDYDVTQHANAYLAGGTAYTGVQNSMSAVPALRPAPYLVGKLPQGVNPFGAHATDYFYPRELTEEEKRARHVYWGQVPTKGTGLPKFDGKDFYPPSPVKAEGKIPSNPPVRAERSGADRSIRMSSTDNDPFRPNRDVASIRSQESGQKVSRAIPIVDPDTGKPTTTPAHVRKDAKKASEGSKTVSPTSIQEKPVDDNPQNGRGAERSSNKSGHDLWHTMLKKGSPSGMALPSTVSSTTATGYLPQYFGHAAASLTPAVSNAIGSTTRLATGTEGKLAELDHGVSQGPADKFGENRPPREGSESESDLTKNIL